MFEIQSEVMKKTGKKQAVVLLTYTLDLFWISLKLVPFPLICVYTFFSWGGGATNEVSLAWKESKGQNGKY